MEFTTREQIVEVVNKLFTYTDEQDWDGLQSEVFTEDVWFDMSSLGQEAATLTAKKICHDWQIGFAGLDAINHLAGNYIVTVHTNEADVKAYATATHYKADASKGTTREFVGTYELHLVDAEYGWRIDRFKYILKYMTGNVEMN